MKVLIVSLILVSVATARRANQAIKIKGELKCGDQPLRNAKVRLFSKYSESKCEAIWVWQFLGVGFLVILERSIFTDTIQ